MNKKTLIYITLLLILILVWLGFYKKDWPTFTVAVLVILLVIGFFSLISGHYLNAMIILFSLILMVYIACKDDREILKEFREVALTRTLIFYKENLKYPTFKEAKSILEESGCSKFRDRNNNSVSPLYMSALYTCSYKYGKINVGVYTRENSTNEAFSYRFSKGKSMCMVDFDDKGNVVTQFCEKYNCFFSPIRG